jgi:hypothetical protein
MDIGSIIDSPVVAWVALAIVLPTAFYQLWCHFRRLQMRIVGFAIPYVHNNTSLVLVRLAFVNPSSRYRTVCDISVDSTLKNVTVQPPVLEYLPNQNTLNYKLPKDETRCSIPIAEALLPPLDIFPHQSQSKWLAFLLEIPVELGTESQATVLEFRAYDYRKKQIADCCRVAVAGKICGFSFPFR